MAELGLRSDYLATTNGALDSRYEAGDSAGWPSRSRLLWFSNSRTGLGALMDNSDAELKVGAHVLVQLGSELVTDVEQAILECVKNSYDADSPGCRIEIDTHEIGTKVETGSASRLEKFTESSDTVRVSLCDSHGQPVPPNTLPGDTQIERHLAYTGRITIEDTGDGLTPGQLQDSWLVISGSNKRATSVGPKPKTAKGRTPLGDKGLGRLGSMKLGDILRIETATSQDQPLALAQFRWTDCESAKTVDEIPVFVDEIPNIATFKGTRVSVLGLKDLTEWRRKDRVLEIAKSLARLISPFEATSTFPVGVTLDGVDCSLVSVTEDVLKRAIAEFHFSWDVDAEGNVGVLHAEARFRKRLFMARRSEKAASRADFVFGQDNGAAFGKSLESYGRLKAYDKAVDIDGPWFIELKRDYQWKEMQPDSGSAIANPGPFAGAFYFFHLDKLDEPDEDAAAGVGVDRRLIKDMAGISILRDGFRIRSQGDWLDLSSGMTSGSTYNMRVDNTIGYFALTGERNYRLIEKSDREGFVEDAAYRGFMLIARRCRIFANDALEQVRRALDDYYKKEVGPGRAPVARTTEGSLQNIEDNLRSAREAKETADRIATELQQEIDSIEREAAQGKGSHSQPAARALKLANNAVRAVNSVKAKLSTDTHPELDLRRLQHEFDERSEQAAALLESAAVGLSARGLVHELRTHLTEIRQRASALEKETKGKTPAGTSTLPHLRAIRAACTAISNAAALIDPMLPRARNIKEEIDLKEFVEGYLKSRSTALDRAGISTVVSGAGRTVRANRSRLTQVLDNLVRNSAYWLRRTMRFGELDNEPQIQVDLVRDGFVVSDSGPGVDPRYEESLFEIFVTAKPERDEGQGLGLFIARQLLQIDGCDITLLSDRNRMGRRYRFAVNLRPLIKA